jgi:3-hydroxyisobutyrate dehydrogenase-like beta-hydroxyacid dehydrogenase
MKSFTSDQVSLGFVGVGAMGGRLVRRLLERGYQVVVYDLDRNKTAELAADGAIEVESLSQLAGYADVILSCLTNDAAVRNAYLAPSGIFAGIQPGKVVLEMSTIAPETSREVHSAGIEHGANVLDVAISGSLLAVEQGAIVLLAGGDEEVFEAAQPIFTALARSYFLMGPAGSGTSMKLVVNTLLGVGMQAVAEAIALGEAEGLPRKRLLDVLSHTAVIAPAHMGKLATAGRGDYSPQFPVALMNKDYRLILESADASDLVLPATAAAFKVNSAAFKEDPAADFSSVIRQMERSVEFNVSGQ